MNWGEKLKQFLHDPVDKCFDIPNHIQRAGKYAEIIGISNLEAKGPDQIASCMERSVLPKEKKVIQNFNEIRHPLSEGKIGAPEFNKNEIFEKMENIFSNLQLPTQDKDKFFYLWRNLIEIVSDEFKKFKNTSIGKYIHVLPADTRIPDHSIWEHLKIASAVNAFWNKENKQLYQNNSLFLFSIGPVQSFISQARKTQDLFMGSFILSYLTFKAIEVIVEKFGPTNIIYPDLHRQPLMDYLLSKSIKVKNSSENYIDQPTIPNRFVAILPVTEKNEIENIANDAKKCVIEGWKEMVNSVLEEFNLPIDNQLKEKQTKNFPEIYWTAIPLKKDNEDVKINDFVDFFEKDEIEKWQDLYKFIEEKGEHPPNIGLLYQLAYSSIEKSIRARKNLRDFVQTEESGKKCHLCGERQGFIKECIGSLKVGKYISKKEGLCVKCFTKRALEKYLEGKFKNIFKDFSFPSTAEVAVTDFKEKALEKAQKEFKEYIMEFKDLVGEKKFKELIVNPLPKIRGKFKDIENLEGEWFFEENLREKEFKDQFDIGVKDEEIQELKNKLKSLTEEVGQPNPYYAIIKIDADNIGKWLSSEKLPSIEYAYNSETWTKLPPEFKDALKEKIKKKILTPAIHSTISHALKNYSIEIVRKVVEEEHLGKLVYAGGDDALAFVNLKDLLDVIRKLRAGFSGHITFKDGTVNVDWENNKGFIEKDDKYLLTMGPQASVSAGVVIAHYKRPLKLVLDKLWEMERKAKNIDDNKDAFGIALIKHTGQIKEFVCKWKKENETVDAIEKINKISKFFKKDANPKLSKTFIYKLHNDFIRLKDEEGNFNATSGIFKTEVKRLLFRSLEEVEKKEKEKIAKELTEILSDLFWCSGIGGNVNKFIALLEVAAFIYRSED